jgi:hypothetical protein
MRSALSIGLALMIFHTAGGTVLGQEQPDLGGGFAPRTEEAARHHKQGLKLYSMGRYLGALREFRLAHKLDPMPETLVNIAACQEQLDRPREALATLEDHRSRYPKDPGREKVELKIAELKRKLLLDYAETEEPAAEASTLEKRPGWPLTLGWVALAAGGASLLMGAVFGGLASAKASEYDDNKAIVTYTALQEIERDGARFEGLQIGTLVAGGVLAVTGAVLVLVYREPPVVGSPPTAGAVVPFASGDSVGLSAVTRF